MCYDFSQRVLRMPRSRTIRAIVDGRISRIFIRCRCTGIHLLHVSLRSLPIQQIGYHRNTTCNVVICNVLTSMGFSVPWVKAPTEIRTRVIGFKVQCDYQLHHGSYIPFRHQKGIRFTRFSPHYVQGGVRTRETSVIRTWVVPLGPLGHLDVCDRLEPAKAFFCTARDSNPVRHLGRVTCCPYTSGACAPCGARTHDHRLIRPTL